MTRINQHRTNPSQAISNFKGRWDTVFGWPSTAISTWFNGGLFGGLNVSYTITSGAAATNDYVGSDGLSYRSLTFTYTSQITFDQTADVEVLLIAGGGGGGGSDYANSAGGGGSGGYREFGEPPASETGRGTESKVTVTAGQGLTVTIGGGGTGALGASGSGHATNGSLSKIAVTGGSDIVSVAGGAGGSDSGGGAGPAGPSGGGSGAGANSNGLSGFVVGGAAATYGMNGGNSRYTGAYPGHLSGGGGGGAGGHGNRIVSWTWPVFSFSGQAHTSGEGEFNDYRTGSNEFRGGGGSNIAIQFGYGTDGSFALKGQQGVDFAGGGDGYTTWVIQNTSSVLGTTSEANAAATANTGGGGGGVATNTGGVDGGPGGSGVCIFKIPFGN